VRGTTSVLPNWRLRDPGSATPDAIVHLLQTHRITRALVPPSIGEILASAGTVPLHGLMTGGGPVFPDLLQRLQQVMPKSSDIVSVYGSTEAEPIAWQRASAITDSQWRAMQTGAGLLAGRPIGAVDLTLIDEEIVVTGDHVNKSYLGGQGDADNKTSIDGRIWHRTGDAERLDADGSLWLRGRISGRCPSRSKRRRDCGLASGGWPSLSLTGARCWLSKATKPISPPGGKPQRPWRSTRSFRSTKSRWITVTIQRSIRNTW
jgi:olefin beta-lactone synthetase